MNNFEIGDTFAISEPIDTNIAIVVTAGYAIVVTIALLKILDATLGLRVSSSDEEAGMDKTVHAEEAYLS